MTAMRQSIRRSIRNSVPPKYRHIMTEAAFHPRLFLVEHNLSILSATVARHIYGESLDRADSLNDHEFKVSSQHGEDGVLMWLFSRIGTFDQRFVEIGASDGIECITANLAARWGWSGLMVEGSSDLVATAKRVHAGRNVNVRHAMVQAETIESLLKDEGFDRSFDLLSIDIDGNDYWVWEAIRARPRVLCIEYNACYGRDRAVTIPYDSNWEQDKGTIAGSLSHGASLAALTKLSAKKGYSLIGCETSGINAFFVDDEYLGDLSPLSIVDAWRPNLFVSDRFSQDEQQRLAFSLPVIEV